MHCAVIARILLFMNTRLTPAEEHVVLVDEANTVLGTAPKATVHQKMTPLHRGFSAFLFYPDGQLLLQQRSHKKKTWPLMWSNSVCGHPALSEDVLDAAQRRMRDELGITAVHALTVASPYRYQFSKDGVMENEICPILIGRIANTPTPNPDEVEAVRTVPWDAFLREIAADTEAYSPWCIEEAYILDTLHSEGVPLW